MARAGKEFLVWEQSASMFYSSKNEIKKAIKSTAFTKQSKREKFCVKQQARKLR